MNVTFRCSHGWPTIKRLAMITEILSAKGASSVNKTHHYTTARFAFDVSSEPYPVPSATETLPLAEQARRSLLSICKHLARRKQPSLADADIWPPSPASWGKDERGQPQTGHQH